MTQGYKRFKKELARARDENVRLVLITETTLKEVLRGYSHSGFDGQAMARKLFTLRVRYGLETVFCDGRSEMARYIREFYYALGKEYATDACSMPVDSQYGVQGRVSTTGARVEPGRTEKPCDGDNADR